MPLDQSWFEMPEIRRRWFERAVWIPLRAKHKIHNAGRYGHLGHKEEFFGVGSLAVHHSNRAIANKLGWMNIGISNSNCGYIQDDTYYPAHIYPGYENGDIGESLVLEQRGNSLESEQWHLAQDISITLGLKREHNAWVRFEEGYDEVVKIHESSKGVPYLLEIKSNYLKDYLCARNMALYITSYRSRVEIVDKLDGLSWPEQEITEKDESDRWMGRIGEIHEGGQPFGASTAVFHASRTDIDTEEDVPVFHFPTDDQIHSDSWVVEHTGKKLYRVQGELWRKEWIEPGTSSPIIRGDKVPATVFFITDAQGTQESRETLDNKSRWLWFRPEVMANLAHRRGGGLRWYTAQTGSVGCSPDDGVHFGINRLGLINVYAKDIGLLPDWQQKIWAGFNIAPDGKVSEELLASQMGAQPANTQAPEAFLEKGLHRLALIGHNKIGIDILRYHEAIPELVKRCHRFRAVDSAGLYSLAKDIARITADCIDATAIQTVVQPPTKEKWGSLKSLEKLLATKIAPELARSTLSSLVGVYELRHGDAHLPSSDIKAAFKLVEINPDLPFIFQGQQMLHSCVTSIFRIIEVFKNWHDENNE